MYYAWLGHYIYCLWVPSILGIVMILTQVYTVRLCSYMAYVIMATVSTRVCTVRRIPIALAD